MPNTNQTPGSGGDPDATPGSGGALHQTPESGEPTPGFGREQSTTPPLARWGFGRESITTTPS